MGKWSARRVAYEMLMKWQRQNAYAHLVLQDMPELEDERDRRLATRLYYGVIENKMRLDYIIDACCAKPPQPVIYQILRMGLYQILYMDRIPEAIACNESVQLAKEIGKGALAQLVNGVLRRVIREPKWQDMSSELYPAILLERLSVWYSWPIWILTKLQAQWGQEQLQAFLDAQPIAGTPLRAFDEAAFAQYCTQQDWETQPGKWADVHYLQNTVDISQDAAYRNGLYNVQTETSAFICRLLDAQPGEQVLDACAAPGGKSAAIAHTMGDSGRVVSCDIHAHRVALIDANAKRLHLSCIQPVQWDATQLQPEWVGAFDRVLLDVPCSGLGTVSSKPDIRYRMQESDIVALSKLQSDILATCSQYVKSGGILVYSTCTLLREENQDVTATLDDDFEPDWLDCFPPDIDRDRIQPDGFMFLPHMDGLEGFYVCRFRRKG